MHASLLLLTCIALCAPLAFYACGEDASAPEGSDNSAGNNAANNSPANNNPANNNPANNNPANNAPNNSPANNAPNNSPANNAPNNNLPERARFEDLIRGDRYTRLVLELDAVPGRAPRPAARAALVEQLEQLLDKPGGVSWTDDGALTSQGEDYAWPFEEIDAMAQDTFDLEVPEDTIKIHVLYVDGHSADDTAQGRILGQAWRYTHLVIYSDTIDSSCSSAAPLPTLAERFCVTAETTILLHEVGHLIGLVDNGLAMQTPHRDDAHGRHDNNDECLMYWAYNGPDFFSSLGERFLAGRESVPTLDQACLDDIAAVRDAE